MPNLSWLGKDKVVTYHQKVPFHFLDKKFSIGNSENSIIHGDNLIALKSLLPRYENKIKCIYIDPPYNTGNENWIYNDNVSDARLQKWLGQVVGKEGEDLTRHDKWLCMMYPRLRLLQKLLADDGAIFISIDDNEQANLKLICNEIFGTSNFVTQFNWRRRTGANDALNNVSIDHEYILCYAKNINNFNLNGVEKNFEKYTNPDNDPRGEWAKDNLTCGKTAEQRPNLFYPITDPKTGITYQCNPNRVWSFEKEKMQELIATDKVIFPKDGKGRPAYKRHKSELRSELKPFSSIIDTQLNAAATRELREIFGKQVFDYPKTVDLIQQIIFQSTDKNSIVLDSFAGSGTTAHAVINLNTADGGNRKFILIELNDYAENITAERVKRVGGEFNFYEIGAPLFDEDDFINSAVPFERICEYIYFSETRKNYQPCEEKNLLGVDDDTAYYYFGGENLSWTTLSKIKTRAKVYVIYAEACNLSEDEMQKYNIHFRQIPFDVRRY